MVSSGLKFLIAKIETFKREFMTKGDKSKSNTNTWQREINLKVIQIHDKGT